MNKMMKNHDTAYCFAVLKLLEQAHKDGHIPAFMFRNILNDYADVVDLSQFTVVAEKEMA